MASSSASSKETPSQLRSMLVAFRSGGPLVEINYKDRRKVVSDRIRKDVLSWIVRQTMYPELRGTSEAVVKYSLMRVVQKTITEVKDELSLIFSSKIEMRDFVWNAVEETIQDLYTQVHTLAMEALITAESIQALVEDIDEMILSKEKAIDCLELHLGDKSQRDPSLDESCAFGLKPLRRALTHPYFKTADGLLSAPTPFVPSKQYKDAFFPVTKQKWTMRDIKSLKDCITSTLAEEMLGRAKAKHDNLLSECLDIHERKMDAERIRKLEASSDGEDDEPPPPKRGPGRAKKNPVVATIQPCLFYTKAFTVHYQTDNAQISEWFKKEWDKINKMKYNVICKLYGATVDNIDWYIVSNKLMTETKKLRDVTDCRLGYKFCADAALNLKRLSPHQKHVVEEMERNKNNSWSQIGAAISRDEFRTFFYWRNSIKAQKKFKYNWNAEKDAKLVQLAIEYKGNWHKVAAEIDERSNKKLVIERFKKTKNPLLRFGKVTRVEDCLLMLTIEKLKAHLKQENHFGELTAYLPWRYESSWRDRAENLFAEYIVPWTLEEDQTLLNLVAEMKNDWSKIAKKFTSFKTRKGCLTRYKILQKSQKKHNGLEAYHTAYSMVRYNVRKFSHLKDVVTLLKKIVIEPRLPFAGLQRGRPPTESELQDMLLAFDKSIMAAAITSMEKYIEFRDDYWNHYNQQNGITVPEKKKTHDRRTFHRESAQSVASALHIRGIKLQKELAKSETLTPFEKDVYKYYAQFCSTKALKKDKDRPYIPEESQLIRMPEVRRILCLNRAQQEMQKNPAFENSTFEFPAPRGRGRPRKPILLEGVDMVSRKTTLKKTKGEAAPRKRGRPSKKNEAAAKPVSSSKKIDSGAVVAPKRGRGRPSKKIDAVFPKVEKPSKRTVVVVVSRKRGKYSKKINTVAASKGGRRPSKKIDTVAPKSEMDAVASKHEKLSKKIDAVAPKVGKPSKKIDTVAPKGENDAVASTSEKLCKKTDPVAPKVGKPSKKIGSVAPKIETDAVASKREKLSKKIDTVALKVGKPSKKIDTVAPKIETDAVASTSKREKLSKKTDAVAPKVGKPSKKIDGVAPKIETDAVASKGLKLSKKTDAVAPKVGKPSKKINSVAPKNEIDAVASKREKLSKKTDAVAPKVGKSSKRTDAVAPKVVKPSKKTVAVALKPERPSKKIKTVAPKVEKPPKKVTFNLDPNPPKKAPVLLEPRPTTGVKRRRSPSPDILQYSSKRAKSDKKSA